MSILRPFWCCLLGLGLGAGRGAAQEDLGLAAPPGFEVSLFADDSLAHDIFSLTIDSQGRVVVAGPGYVKTLHDADGDGRAERATLFSPLPASGAHGLVFDGPNLVCTGDDAVLCLSDANGDGRADGSGQRWARLRHPEHGANGVVRGPDGWFYLICGNDAGVAEEHAQPPGWPVRRPACGALLRFSPDGRQSQVLADGFRNPYDLDFHWSGQVLTVDSDGERDHFLPWYAPTRLFDVAIGQGHGWLLSGWTRSWNRPQSYLDSVERLVEFGRGSPTGLVAYRHRQFPAAYRDGFFAACWTLGRVYFVPLEPRGATLSGRSEVFLQTTGTIGFAPCDLAVGPEGDLFVAIGGRRTRGSVFRVRYPAGLPLPDAADPLAALLAADQPLAAWSRARWQVAARQLGREVIAQAAADARRSVPQRVRAVEVLVELWRELPADLAQRLADDPEPAVVARLAWALARRPDSEAARALLCRLTGHAHPLVLRAAWEGLLTWPPLPADGAAVPDWGRGLTHADRRVRAAAIWVARGPGQGNFLTHRPLAPLTESKIWRLRLAELWIRHSAGSLDPPGEREDAYLETCRRCLAEAPELPLRLEAVRLAQLKLGDLRIQPGSDEVFCGYQGHRALALGEGFRRRVGMPLAQQFPTPDPELNRELARLLGMLGAEQPGLVDALVSRCTAESSPQDDLHFLIVAALLPGQRTAEATRRTADVLVDLPRKMEARRQQPSRNWPLRVGELVGELLHRDPALSAALADHPGLGRAGHVVLVEQLEGAARLRATRRLLADGAAAADDAPAELVALASALPREEVLPWLRRQWDEPRLRDAIARQLARAPAEEDRQRLLVALASVDPQVVEQAAAALQRLAPDRSPEHWALVLRALKQACQAPHQAQRRALVTLLAAWTGRPATVEERGAASITAVYAPWFEWFAREYPAEARLVGSLSGTDWQTWEQRLGKIDWSRGDAGRGQQVFAAKSCLACHRTSGHLGPELSAAAGRLSRDDLLRAILDPSLEVSPTYQTTLVATESGQVYHGLVVYESPEGTLLQTGPETTVRIAGDERLTLRPSRQSLMPSGLLDDLTDEQIADLVVYVQGLARPAR
jgi:putative heme-binding domain-containing protein